MLNNTVWVGRLVSNPELYEAENGKKACKITLAVPRPYKNADGEYDTDFVNCRLWAGVAQNTAEYCRKGDLIGIKGRIETYNYETEDGKKYRTEVVADRVTFLSSQKDKTQEKEHEEPAIA